MGLAGMCLAVWILPRFGLATMDSAAMDSALMDSVAMGSVSMGLTTTDSAAMGSASRLPLAAMGSASRRNASNWLHAAASDFVDGSAAAQIWCMGLPRFLFW